jgi:hypothetical protein
MNQTSLLRLFVATVTWIPIRCPERRDIVDLKMSSRTPPTELNIPLH